MVNAAKRAVHYGWYVVAVSMLGIFACLGLGRFALGMLLPAMAQALSLSSWQMGLVSTVNFCGYLAAVLLCPLLMKRWGYRRLISLGLLAVGSSMLLIGSFPSLPVLLLLYTITGLGSGFANVPIMALVPVWFAARQRGRAAGFVVIGSGFAIIISGRLVPMLNGLGEQGWRLNWLLLGGVVLVISLLSALVIRNRPADLGLQPVAAEQGSAGAEQPLPALMPQPKRSTLLHCAAVYFLFGATYVIYVTFMVTTLVQEYGFSELVAGRFWAWLGFLSLFSGPIFGSLSDRLGRGKGLALVFAMQAISYLCIGLYLQGPFLALSVGCFGLVAWSVPSIMAALVGDYVGAERAGAVFSFITFLFGMGQVVGPLLAGVLAQWYGGFTASFLLAFALACLAVVLSLFLPEPGGQG